MFAIESRQNEQSLLRTLYRYFLPSFGSFGQAVSEEKIFFRNWPTRNKNCLWRPCSLKDPDEMCIRYRGPSIAASSQVWGFGQAVSEEKILFRNQLIRNNNWLWWPCLLTDPDEMSNHYIRPSLDAFYQVSVHLTIKRLQRRIFLEID